ncbi:GyrI-like domain-containing protein [Spirochaetota bacterium]
MKKVLIAILIIIVCLLGFLAYSGLFSSVKITEKETGPFTIVCERHVGDYSKVGKIYVKVYETLLKDFNVKTVRGAGIYYDDPKKVDKNKLRSDVGSIIEKKDYARIPDIKKKFKIIVLPKKSSIVAEFPYKNPLSIFIGIMRVYPKLGEYLKDKKDMEPFIMELYDMPNKKIEFIAPRK